MNVFNLNNKHPSTNHMAKPLRIFDYYYEKNNLSLYWAGHGYNYFSFFAFDKTK